MAIPLVLLLFVSNVIYSATEWTELYDICRATTAVANYNRRGFDNLDVLTFNGKTFPDKYTITGGAYWLEGWQIRIEVRCSSP